MTLLPDDLVLRGDRVTLRPSREDDVDALTALLAEPAITRWWRESTREDVRQELHVGVTILVGDVVSGWLLVHEETDPEYPSVAFDIALATRLHGAGYGQEALRVMVRHCIAAGHHRFTIDPAVDNRRAIASYAAVGFKPVGVLREQELWPDGRWGDALLMDLLARELVE
jgi:aminoglycoside 6'-N-acetyltransferase